MIAQYLKEGWRPHGPGRCRCADCGAICSTNALARASHVCPTPTHYPNGKPIFAKDGTMLDERGNRSIFDDIDK